ncbi:MAG: hypothetical protein U0Q47_03845 [Mycobacterium sp.]
MRVAVFGANGQIGSTVCELLRSEGHDVVDPAATYFGARVDDDSLVTGEGAVLGSIGLGG